MENCFLIGLDAGTTSIKGIICDTKGRIIASEGKEYMLENGLNTCELNPDIYWETSLMIIKKLILKSNIPAINITGLAISSQGETLIPIDKFGKALRKAFVWLDNRSGKECGKIESTFGRQKICEITGQCEIVPSWPATKILWMRDNEPDLFKKADKFLLVSDYIAYKLTGVFASDESMLSSTLYFDIKKKCWWNEMLSFLGINEHQLPLIKRSGDFIANVLPEITKICGLNASTQVLAGAYDHAAGAVGAGNIYEGLVTETTGASMAMVVSTQKPVSNLSLNIPLQCHAAKDMYFLLPYGQTAGMVLKWFKDEFCKEENRRAEVENLDVYDMLTRLAETIPIGCEGLMMLPHLMGTGSPEFNSKVRGSFTGIGMGMHKGHFIRAIMESVVYMINKNLEVLKINQIDVKEIRAQGGAAKSRLWTQMLSDTSNLPIITLESEQTPALGAAILAGTGVGIYPDLKTACKNMVRIKDWYTPIEKNHRMYQQFYKKYQGLYQCLEKYWE